MSTHATPQRSELTRIAVIVGSTRPNRRSRLVAEWAQAKAAATLGDRADIVLVDIADFALPLLDEPVAAAVGKYTHEHTRRWAHAIGEFDGFVFVTPEYNHSMPAALKNAIDYLYAEWNDKAAGFVSYGLDGGVRAVEALRLTLAEVKIACVRSSVALSLSGDFDLENVIEPGTVAPGPRADAVFDRMIDEVLAWSTALSALRTADRS
ncbi:NADPH-dependent FMN reductase [Gordonia sp. (in: high G+C Gram-positive bacteria)]|uniref:NADPH-dependent FMN reductase n=1 Tax=Gordonia sp. (in: high G+C Gram-positive bacteria) TaxID=84139 RepID=UPI003F9D6E2D